MGQRQLVLLTLLFGLLLAALPVRAGAPDWQQLTPQQQAALAPVSARWNGMSVTLRHRLLAAAAKYPAMRPDQQKRFQKRLLTWSSLTQAQRDQARKNYLRLKKLPPDRRRQIKQRLLAAHPPMTVYPGQQPASAEGGMTRVVSPAGHAQGVIEPIPVRTQASGGAAVLPAVVTQPASTH